MIAVHQVSDWRCVCEKSIWETGKEGQCHQYNNWLESYKAQNVLLNKEYSYSQFSIFLYIGHIENISTLWWERGRAMEEIITGWTLPFHQKSLAIILYSFQTIDTNTKWNRKPPGARTTCNYLTDGLEVKSAINVLPSFFSLKGFWQ